MIPVGNRSDAALIRFSWGAHRARKLAISRRASSGKPFPLALLPLGRLPKGAATSRRTLMLTAVCKVAARERFGHLLCNPLCESLLKSLPALRTRVHDPRKWPRTRARRHRNDRIHPTSTNATSMEWKPIRRGTVPEQRCPSSRPLGDSRMSRNGHRTWATTVAGHAALSSAMAGSNDCSIVPRPFRMFQRSCASAHRRAACLSTARMSRRLRRPPRLDSAIGRDNYS